VSLAVPPRGVVAPKPVTTTVVALMSGSWRGERLGVYGSAGGALDVGDGVADGLEVLGVLVGDGDAELVLAGVDDLDHGQRVDAQVVDEGLVQLHVLDSDAGDVVDDLGEVGADFFGA